MVCGVFFDFIPFSSFYIYYSTHLVQFTEPIRRNYDIFFFLIYFFARYLIVYFSYNKLFCTLFLLQKNDIIKATKKIDKKRGSVMMIIRDIVAE